MERNSEKNDSKSRRGLLDPGIFPIFIPQAMFGLIFTIVSFYIGYYHGDFILPTSEASGAGNIHLSSRLSYALCCSFPMLLSLYAGILVVATKRGLTAAVNPLAGNERVVQLHKNYLANTLEQFVVGLMLMLIIAAYADSLQVLRLLPVYSIVFTTSRIFFWIGYSISPFYRTIGMSIGFLSTYVLFGVVFYYMWTKGLQAAVLGNTQLLGGSHPLEHQEL